MEEEAEKKEEAEFIPVSSLTLSCAALSPPSPLRSPRGALPSLLYLPNPLFSKVPLLALGQRILKPHFWAFALRLRGGDVFWIYFFSSTSSNCK